MCSAQVDEVEIGIATIMNAAVIQHHLSLFGRVCGWDPRDCDILHTTPGGPDSNILERKLLPTKESKIGSQTQIRPNREWCSGPVLILMWKAADAYFPYLGATSIPGMACHNVLNWARITAANTAEQRRALLP